MAGIFVILKFPRRSVTAAYGCGSNATYPRNLVSPFSPTIRSNLVLRWEYSPGSTLFVVWNHNRSATSNDPNFGGFDEFGRLLKDPMANSFLVKVNYWTSL